MLHVHRSNRTEILVDVLAELYVERAQTPSPDDAACLAPDWMVVQGRGMAVWLATELATRLGVWAGGGFLYPRNFVARAFEAVVGTAEPEAFHPDRLTWAVMAALREHLHDERLSPIARYLEPDRDDGTERYLRRLALARRIGYVFDQYLTYRPEMLRAWESGDDDVAIAHGEAWQPLVWRSICGSVSGGVREPEAQHLAALEEAFAGRLEANAQALPRRMFLFGLASLPPLYVRVLGAMSRHVEVHWLLPVPAAGHFSDMVGRLAADDDVDVDLHLGNPLLASLGKLPADLQHIMTEELDALGVTAVDHDHYAPPSRQTLLTHLQADLFDVTVTPFTAADDDSIAIHACHSPMRQVEVLHDQLLALLTSRGGTLRPRDVIVMVPDIETYAPLIEAVFERSGPDFIPYAIADQPLRRDSAVAEAFDRILGLVGGRARASEIADLLALGPIRAKLGLGPEDVDQLARWIVDSGIRWGIDADHRKKEGQPGVPENTWQFGLDRLLVGYALPTAGEATYAGVLPYDEVEGQQAVLLGKLALLTGRLFAALADFATPRSVSAWRDSLIALLDELMIQDAETAWQHQRIREALVAMAANAAAVDFDEPVGLAAIRALLTDALDEGQPARRFLSAGVTFCAMVPMRSIPFRVVCLLGLGDGDFPRTRRPLDFDLLVKAGTRPGDRSRRDDDRYLFLEAIMAARERLLITYTGQSIRNNEDMPASVVVSELCDYLASVRDHSSAQEEHERIVRHPLQPFSPRYFDGAHPRLFSFAEAYLASANQLERGRDGGRHRLFDVALDPPDDEVVELSQLVRFFEGPVRHLIETRLGIDMRDRLVEVPDREPVELEPLEAYEVGRQLLDMCLADLSEEETARLLRASGALPVGTPGVCAHADALAQARPIAAHVRRVRGGDARPGFLVDGEIDGYRLRGELGDLFPGGAIRHQYARVSGKSLVALWVRHLIGCWQGACERSVLVGRGQRGPGTWTLGPVAQPLRHLKDLFGLYRYGQSRPLVFFPKAGFVYTQGMRDAKNDRARGRALSAARSEWTQRELRRCPYLTHVFRDAPDILTDVHTPLGGPTFKETASLVFGPLLDHLEVRDVGGIDA